MSRAKAIPIANSAALLTAGVGPRTVRFVHERLVQSLDHARRLRIVARNEAEDATPPALPRHEMKCWNDEEIARFLAVAQDSIYGPLWIVALYTGMRRGELVGLRWQDVDWENAVLHVRQSITVLSHGLVTQSPKSGRHRKISVPGVVLDLLRQHRSRQNERRLKMGEFWHDSGLVFTVGHGGPIRPDNLKRNITASSRVQASQPSVSTTCATRTAPGSCATAMISRSSASAWGTPARPSRSTCTHTRCPTSTARRRNA
jgi:integrase